MGNVWGGEYIPCYIRQPGYITGLIYGPRGPRYNGFPLYSNFQFCSSFVEMGLFKFCSQNLFRNFNRFLLSLLVVSDTYLSQWQFGVCACLLPSFKSFPYNKSYILPQGPKISRKDTFPLGRVSFRRYSSCYDFHSCIVRAIHTERISKQRFLPADFGRL